MGEDQLTGIALFPPPGTKPILRGFVVPDNFEVPEGYVRHYQTTDRGQQLPPILMFHPDYQLVDENGQPIPMPKDRVVPPELLPPGMPTQRLEVPEQPPEEAPDVSVPEENPERRIRGRELGEPAAPRRPPSPSPSEAHGTTVVQRDRIRECAVALGAALVTAAALALDERIEWPWMLLGWVALVPWLAVLDRTRSLREALCSGMLMSLAFVLVTFNWFASSIQAYTGAPRAVALLVMALLAPILEPQFITLRAGATSGAAAGSRRRTALDAQVPFDGAQDSFWRTAIVGACVYVGTESVWPKLFGDSLGYGLYPSMWMRQAADLAGVYGLTFVLVIANECMLAIFRALGGPLLTSPVARGGNRGGTVIRDALAPAACVVASILALLAYGAVRCAEFHAKAALRRDRHRRTDPGRHQPIRPHGRGTRHVRSGAPHPRCAFRALERSVGACHARFPRLAGDRVSDDVRLAQERSGRGLRSRDRRVRHQHRRAAGVRRLRRRSRRRVQRRHILAAGEGQQRDLRRVPQGVAVPAHRARAGAVRISA